MHGDGRTVRLKWRCLVAPSNPQQLHFVMTRSVAVVQFADGFCQLDAVHGSAPGHPVPTLFQAISHTHPPIVPAVRLP